MFKFVFLSDKIVEGVLSELGIELTGQLAELKPGTSTIANSKGKATAAAEGDADNSDADLEARLNALRRS